MSRVVHPDLVEQHHAIAVLERECAESHGVDDAERRRGAGDRERDRCNGGNEKRGAREEGAYRDAEFVSRPTDCRVVDHAP